MTLGQIVVNIFVQRNGVQEPTVHPLMSRTGRPPLRAWNTGFIFFTLHNHTISQDFDMPNWINNQERMMIIYSPRWMQSAVTYTGSTGEILVRTQFTFHLDERLRTERHDFFDGHIIVKYAGRLEEI
jgi:hypothetical protein